MPTSSPSFELPTVTQLADLSHMFHAVSPGFPAISVVSRYRTAIQIGDDGAEHRRLLRLRPERVVHMPIAALSTEAVLATRSEMIRRSGSRYLAPLMSDLATLANAAASGQTQMTVTEDLTERRFQVGGRVVIFGTIDANEPAFEVGEISAVTSSQITFNAVLGESWLAGSFVVPLIESELDLDTSGLFFYDESQQNETYTELAGPNSLQTLTTPGTNPTGYTVYDSLPILDLECLRNRTVDYGTQRPGRIQNLGIGSRPATLGSRAAFNWNIGVQAQTRAEVWSLISFFDSRGGDAYPFWFVDPADRLSRDFTFISNDLVLPAQGLAADWADHRTRLVFIYNDDSYEVAVASHAGRANELDTLTLTPNVTETGIRRIHVLRQCRFLEGSLLERWLTPTLCDLDFSITEIPDETDVSALFSTPATVPIVDIFDPDDFVLAPAIALFGVQKDTTNDIHFADIEGTALSGGHDAAGTTSSAVGLSAFRGQTAALVAASVLTLYDSIGETASTVSPPASHSFTQSAPGGSNFIAMDNEQNVYVFSDNPGVPLDLELHSYEPDGTHRWTTSVQTSSPSTGGAQGITNVANNRIGIIVNDEGGSFVRLKIYNATTGAFVDDFAISDTAGLQLDVRTDGTTWYAHTQGSETTNWSDYPTAHGAADLVAYTSSGSWVWGINIASSATTRLFYGRDGYLYVAQGRGAAWPGASGQNATLLKISSSGTITDFFDDATNFSNDIYAVDVDDSGKVLVAGSTDQRIALLDSSLSVVWSEPETDLFGSVVSPQAAFSNGSI